MVELDLCMWDYQRAFQISVNASAQEAFGNIDASFEARVFVVGFGLQTDAMEHTICIEPGTCDYVSECFEEVPGIAATLETFATEEDFFYPYPMPRMSHLSQTDLHAWQQAMEQVLWAEDVERGWRSFIAWPVEVERYLVFCVLQLSRQTWESYYALKRNLTDDAVPVSRSLLYALVEEFLEGCTRALILPNPGSMRYVIDRARDELHRNAGRRLMHTVARACKNYELIETLYDSLAELSATHYEGTDSHGDMLIAPQNHPNIKVIVRFNRPIALTDMRAVRKTLQMTRTNLAALVDGSRIYGLGQVVGTYDQDREDLFIVTFTGYHAWVLAHAGNILMRVRHGQPLLATRALDETQFKSIIRRVFDGVETLDRERLIQLAHAATRQGRGTILVISDQARREAIRLSTQAMPINPVMLNPQLMEAVTAIDGAVLIDQTGTCFAIGVILDGLASDRGTASRGARYNSAIRYVQTARTLGHRCVALVVSEDGPIDIFPDLLPQIRRSLILEKVAAFKEMAESSEVRRRDFNRLMDWFQQYRFCLWDKVCSDINSARKRIEEKLEPSRIWISWPEFTSNPDLDDSYFIDDDD